MNTTVIISQNNCTFVSEEPEEIQTEFHIDNQIWIYTAPIIFFIGVIGNILAIIVLMKESSFRNTPTGVYLTVILWSDLVKLWVGLLPEWLEQMDIVVTKYTHEWICKSEKFLSYTSSNIAIWTLCAFSVDRCLAVLRPMQKIRTASTGVRTLPALLTCLIISVIAIAFGLTVFWAWGVIYDDNGHVISNCKRQANFYFYERKVRPWLVLTFVDVIPLLVITVSNVMLLRCMIVAKKRHDSMRCGSTSGGYNKAVTHSVYISIISAVVFVVCVTPTMILYIGQPYWNKSDDNVCYKISKAVCNQMIYITHSCNIFVYCVTGKMFYEKLLQMFCVSSKKRQQNQTWNNNNYNSRIRKDQDKQVSETGVNSSSIDMEAFSIKL